MPKFTLKRLLGRRIDRGDVAGILPADLPPTRSLQADKAELTRIIEGYAATGGIDRATGGHLLDEMIDSWHRDQVQEINSAFLTREATADRLIGAAEARHQETRQQLEYATGRYDHHTAAAEWERAALIRQVPAADLPHDTFPDRTAARNLRHDRDLTTPAAWSAPWQEETFGGNDPKGIQR